MCNVCAVRTLNLRGEIDGFSVQLVHRNGVSHIGAVYVWPILLFIQKFIKPNSIPWRPIATLESFAFGIQFADGLLLMQPFYLLLLMQFTEHILWILIKLWFMNARVLCALHFAHNHIPAIFNSFTLFYTDLPTAAKAQSSTKGNADGNESFARTFF